MSDNAISARGLSKEYRIGQYNGGYTAMRHGLRHFHRRLRGQAGDATHFWALEDITFDVAEGEVVAVIGRNGAGKSTLLKILSRITDPTRGHVDVSGLIGSLLEVGTGFHPELTGRENVFLNGTILGMSRLDIARKFDEIVEFSGIGSFIDTPVKRYSSGMYVRLAFAVAAHLEPDILVIDEVLSVGDAEFQKRCLGKMGDVAREGRTVLFVSHNMQAVRSLCNRAILLDGGRVIDDGDTESIVRGYLNSVDSSESGRRRWNDPAERPGDDLCQLVEVRVVDEDGDPGTTFFSSQRIDVELEVELTSVHSALSLGFDLVSDDGVCVFRSYQTDMPDAQMPKLHVGRNILRCSLPAGLLNAGTYSISPRLSLHCIKWIAQVDAALSFDVVFDHGESHFLTAIGRPGTVAPILPWTATPAGVAEPVADG